MSSPIIVGDGLHDLDKLVSEIGVAFSGYTIVADDGGAPPNVYDADFGALTGLAVNAGTGAVTGTTTNQAGTTNITLKATNDDGEVGTRVLKLYNSPNGRPSITSPLWYEVIAGEPLTIDLTGSHGATAFGFTGLPPWLTLLDPVTLQGTVPSGPAQVTFKVRGWITDSTLDAGAYADITIDISSGTGGLPVITNDPLIVNLEVGDSLEFQITATNDPTSFAIEDEPAGITCDPLTGLVTSAGAFSEATTFSFTIGATNADGNGQAQLTIIVADNTVPPPEPARNVFPYIEQNAHAEPTRAECANLTTGSPPLPPSNLDVITPGVRGSTTAIATWGNP